MANHTPPIVPHVLFVAEQHRTWRLAPIECLATKYHTPTTVATAFGTVDGKVKPQKGKSGVTFQQYHVWCLPDDAAWQRVQTARTRFQATLDDFAALLRRLGSYATQLEAAGGIKKAPLRLSPTVIAADDPDSTSTSYYISNPVPRIARADLDSHTPMMLRITKDGKPWSVSHQRDHFVCPDDTAWDAVQQRQAAAQAAYDDWQKLLGELGTYQSALADGRYRTLTSTDATVIHRGDGLYEATLPDGRKGPPRVSAQGAKEALAAQLTMAPATAAATPAVEQRTTGAHNDVWHNLPPLLAGWRWIGAQADSRKPPIAQLQAPDGWSTAAHAESNPAIAEALRHMHAQAPALPAVVESAVVGVAMMDAAEARETLDQMRGDLAQADLSITSFRRRALDFADRQGYKALGYTSSAEAINAELGTQYSKSYLSRLLNAARIEQLLELPTGNAEPVPERTLRPLAGLDTPDQQKQAWQAAQASAGGATPSTAQVQQAVEQIKPSAKPALHPDYQHGVEIERILRTLDQWADSERSRVIQEAYSHAREMRDPTQRDRAFAQIDRALEATNQPPPPPPQTRGLPAPARTLGADQPEAAPWPEAPEGWRWNRKGQPAHLIAPDGWRTADYNYPERAIAEAQRRILSQPAATSAPEEWSWGPALTGLDRLKHSMFLKDRAKAHADALSLVVALAPDALPVPPRRPVDAGASAQAAYIAALERYVAAVVGLIGAGETAPAPAAAPFRLSELEPGAAVVTSAPVVEVGPNGLALLPDIPDDSPLAEIFEAVVNISAWAGMSPDAPAEEVRVNLKELRALSDAMDAIDPEADVDDDHYFQLNHAIGDLALLLLERVDFKAVAA